ncbi:basic immunoglobulin-like variable motif-containing protein isoform X1 [Branchiostoma lanceolatum]|uniref:basic immunoglobulin-like variable motif-containing protein isoform X1 n=1 Tax=Branchiostoma lanceolatum TaxID=7740 RepID=UPI00345332B9
MGNLLGTPLSSESEPESDFTEDETIGNADDKENTFGQTHVDDSSSPTNHDARNYSELTNGELALSKRSPLPDDEEKTDFIPACRKSEATETSRDVFAENLSSPVSDVDVKIELQEEDVFAGRDFGVKYRHEPGVEMREQDQERDSGCDPECESPNNNTSNNNAVPTPAPPIEDMVEAVLRDLIGGAANAVTTSQSCPTDLSQVGQRSPQHRSDSWEVDMSSWVKNKVNRKVKRGYVQNALEQDNKQQEEKKDVKKEYPAVSTDVTQEQMALRKVLDLRRWYCMSRPQYQKSCGISSLVSCWNFLFSTLGGGSHRPITQEEALTVLGFKPPFGEIRFGPFTGNSTLMRWFTLLNNHYGVRGRAYYLYKPHGKGRTMGTTDETALANVKNGLRDDNMTLIYHCQNHYFCPVGYEDVPLKAAHAYRADLLQDEVETWLLIGDPSRKHPGLHCIRWSDISTDLNCQNPTYLDIRRLHLGLQTRKTRKSGGNLHCLMAFVKSDWQGPSIWRSASVQQRKEPNRGARRGSAPSSTEESDSTEDLDEETQA